MIHKIAGLPGTLTHSDTGTAIAVEWRWGLWAPSILQIPLFRNRVLRFGPQNPAHGGAKMSEDPIHSVCSQGVVMVPLLAIILRSWHRGS